MWLSPASGTVQISFFPHFPMHVEHFEKGVTYNDQELLLLAKKIGKLATYCRFLKDEGSKIRVEADRRDTKKDRDQVKVMVTVVLPKKVLRAESRKFTALEALDSCTEKLEEQIKAYKEMHSGRAKAHLAKRKSREIEESFDMAA
jgi:ribosome-associated translation inhibitor RaiA